ncbi:hypothetical protein VBD025_14450 [Virgibacillus flavescens]|uniref:hypothetical protein n=1 Tax=Virgibacillus flavescens TaxID=1611422 RepID=UPI003D3324A2
MERISVPRRAKGEDTLSIFVNMSNDFGALHIPEEDKQITKLQIAFPNPLTFSIISDDFTYYDHTEEYSGEAFRIYTKSRHLDYIEKMTQSRNETFSYGECVQYTLNCFEDTVDIFTSIAPSIIEV